jgi:hypothetical protein
VLLLLSWGKIFGDGCLCLFGDESVFGVGRWEEKKKADSGVVGTSSYSSGRLLLGVAASSFQICSGLSGPGRDFARRFWYPFCLVWFAIRFSGFSFWSRLTRMWQRARAKNSPQVGAKTGNRRAASCIPTVGSVAGGGQGTVRAAAAGVQREGAAPGDGGVGEGGSLIVDESPAPASEAGANSKESVQTRSSL